MLGVQIDPQSGKEGARVRKVSPGGPAEEAGLRDGDVIVALDGKAVRQRRSGRAVVEHMRNVKPEQKVKVRVLRDGKKKDFVVVGAAHGRSATRMFNMRLPEMGTAMAGMADMAGGCRSFRQFRSLSAQRVRRHWSWRASRPSSAPTSARAMACSWCTRRRTIPSSSRMAT